MKVKDNTKTFIRICLAIILVAVVFLVYKLHFKGSDVDFISNINENYTITIEKEVTLIDNTDYKRLHIGDEFTTYQLAGDKAVEFKDVISSLKIRKLLRSSVSTKHVEDFVWYKITVISNNGEKYNFSTHGDYMNIDDYTMFFCKPYGNWRENLDAVLADAEVVEHRVEKPEHLK